MSYIGVRKRSLAAGFTARTILTSLVAMAATPVYAQIEEVIVTAERREANLQSVPIAVTAISSQALDDFQAVKTEDLMRVVPGLKLVPVTANPSNFQVAMRGSSQVTSSLVVAESPVGFYVDDVYVARLNGANAQLADLERVEVLRGPQGTIYGRNTLAGAIKLVTTTPNDETRIRASVAGGDYGRYQISASVGGALGANGFYGSISGLASGFDGYYTNLADNSDYGQEENYSGRAKLRFAPTDSSLDLVAALSYAKSDNDGYVPTFSAFLNPVQNRSSDVIFPLVDPYNVFQADNPNLPLPIEQRPRGETEQTIASLTATYDLDWATIKSVSAWVETEDFFSIEFIGDNRIPVFGPTGGFPGANRSDTSQLSQEIQLQGTTQRLEWLVGVYYFHEDAEQVVALVTNDLLQVETESISVFANGTYTLSDRVSLTAGARWTQDEKDFTGTIRQFGSLAPIFPTVKLDETYDAFTPKFGINYQISEDTLLYASVGRGFKSGGFNGVAFGNLAVLQTPYDPETNWTYEAGLKADFWGNRFRVNAAAYLNDVSDVTMGAVNESEAGVSFPVQNSGDAEITGLEVELTFQPTPRLNLFANFTLQDAEYTSLNEGSDAAIAEAAFGSATPPQVPDLAYTIGGSYTFDVPYTSGGTITIGGDHYYTDDYFIAAANDFIIDSYSRSSAYVTYGFSEQLEARLAATNINDGVDIPSGAAVFNSVVVHPPRQIMFSVSYAY